jgi:hydrogenase expression/formation protein HypD
MPIQEHIAAITRLAEEIARPVKLMEVCGTHTMAAFRSGLRSLLPENVSLLSGPGCPVCVTPNAYLDKALAIVQQPDTIVATFGDMVRVPGSESSLEYARAQGATIRIVYSPADALEEAAANPSQQVVFLGVGFETTIPGIAWTIKEAAKKSITNYSVLCGHKIIPPAMEALLQGEVKIDGFMCPGHVSVIIGADAYKPLCSSFHIPCVVTGFEPFDMIVGIEMLLDQIIKNQSTVEIQYVRSVTEQGNQSAQQLINEVFEVCDSGWRGIGTIPDSGLRIRDAYSDHDAEKKFKALEVPVSKEYPGCICGEILRGIKIPYDCGLFRKACTPATPVGACMVSSEGTCAAYYKYARVEGSKKP